jgi:hypothetical protein
MGRRGTGDVLSERLQFSIIELKAIRLMAEEYVDVNVANDDRFYEWLLLAEVRDKAAAMVAELEAALPSETASLGA